MQGHDIEPENSGARRFWLRFRLFLVLVSAPMWLAIRAEMDDDFSQRPEWHFVLVMFAFAAFASVFMSVIHAHKTWEAPSWRANPLDFDRPAEGIHLTGWSFLSGAFGLVVATSLRSTPDWSFVLPGAVGLGFLVGARLVAIPLAGRCK